jgi:hypothetical protein
MIHLLLSAGILLFSPAHFPLDATEIRPLIIKRHDTVIRISVVAVEDTHAPKSAGCVLRTAVAGGHATQMIISRDSL